MDPSNPYVTLGARAMLSSAGTVRSSVCDDVSIAYGEEKRVEAYGEEDADLGKHR